ncbi:N-formylglutamate amidohydrolase [Tsuneonella mangrovi]|uniref:N-formylglutamate amidohydrolase n=1 Tax=Tsuneonella mangrovi TaxID=1982042 RepID=UPI000BA279F1|nr:N-formylglutamate amidohydrolase [Tsuneonella mangrovi]
MSAASPRTVRSGGSIPGSKEAAFALSVHSDAPIPVLIAAPHGGRSYPPDLVQRMRHAEDAKLRLEDRLVDRLAEIVAEQTGAALLVARAPRAMLDLNRSVDDIDWSVVDGSAPRSVRHSLTNRRARGGLGLVPSRLAGIGDLWTGRIEQADLEARVDGIHRPYHRALAETLESLRDRWGAALLVDLHSMPPLQPRHPGHRPAEFVIGDRFGASCDPALSSVALAYLERQGRPIAHNRPYAGGFVLDRHGAAARGIHAMQVEVCRSTYLDRHLREPSANLPHVAGVLAGMVRELADQVAALGRGSAFALAAE